MFDSSMVNEQSGFEPLKFYCINATVNKEMYARFEIIGTEVNVRIQNIVTGP